MRVLLTICALLVFPTVAVADRVDRDALTIAVAYWGPTPCEGLTLRHVTDRAVAEASDAYGALAYADTDRCEIGLGHTLRADYNYAGRCSVILHEMGHLHGMQHGPGVMSPRLTAQPVCLEAARAKRAGCKRGRRCLTRWALL